MNYGLLMFITKKNKTETKQNMNKIVKCKKRERERSVSFYANMNNNNNNNNNNNQWQCRSIILSLKTQCNDIHKKIDELLLLHNALKNSILQAENELGLNVISAENENENEKQEDNNNPHEISTMSIIQSMEDRDITKCQKKEEWLKARLLKITASECYRCLGSEQVLHTFVKDKTEKYLKFLQSPSSLTEKPFVKSLLHGERYEPVAVHVFETLILDNVQVRHDFGLIEHFDENMKFIGASPDGLVVSSSSSSSSLKLLEIKCPISRSLSQTIYEIPNKYIYQMQLQMEVCQIDECYYLEVLFKELESISALISMMEELMTWESPQKTLSKFGIVRQVEMKHHGKTIDIQNEYCFFDAQELQLQNNKIKDLVHETYQAFQNQAKENQNLEFHEIFLLQQNQCEKYIFYYVEDYKLHTIQRNQQWFKNSLPKFRYCHNKILEFSNNFNLFEDFLQQRKSKQRQSTPVTIQEMTQETTQETTQEKYKLNSEQFTSRPMVEETKLTTANSFWSRSDVVSVSEMLNEINDS